MSPLQPGDEVVPDLRLTHASGIARRRRTLLEDERHVTTLAAHCGVGVRGDPEGVPVRLHQTSHERVLHPHYSASRLESSEEGEKLECELQGCRHVRRPVLGPDQGQPR